MANQLVEIANVENWERQENASKMTHQPKMHNKQDLKRHGTGATLTALQKTTIINSVTSSEVLGNGAYGKVLKMTYNGEEIAVKVTESERATKNDAQNEAHYLAKLRASGRVPELKFFFENDDIEYLGMTKCLQSLYNFEHWEKGSLQKFLHQALLALEYCHHKKIVHRDIKLDNFMVTIPNADHKVKIQLCDFGIAIRVGSIQKKLKRTSYLVKVQHATPDVFGKFLEPFPKDDVVQLSYCALHAVWHDQADFYGMDQKAKKFKKNLISKPQDCLTAEEQWLLPFFQAIAQWRGTPLDYSTLKTAVQEICPDSDPAGPLTLITNTEAKLELI